MKLNLLLLFVLTVAVLAQVPTYENYWYVYADGARIDLPVGHASPLVTDWDNDGDKDLLLGRYLNGNIMLYTNSGTNDSPILSYTGLLQAGGGNLSVPSG
ncbi:MAG: hypothetical protein KAR40_09480 [Candidatus Sabulitectum sp.]|nr:hypothetical protein [Candidatus Sabulitectum sp.]